MDYKFWRNLRNKENKTEEELLLLKLHESLAIVSEILVSYDKCHYSEGKAIEEIRNILMKYNL